MANDNILHLAEIEVSYNPVVKPSEMVKISCSLDAERIFRSIWSNTINLKESFYVLNLNRTNKVLGYQLISIGEISGTVVDPKCIFQVTLKINSTGLIIAHNHVSGNPEPSDADIKITSKIKNAGELLDVALLDHLILLPEGYTSLVDEGIL
jgi:DNA repair protein RadC